MVCIVNEDFDLSQSERSNRLLQRAGPNLQVACNSRGSIKKGQVQETNAFQLPYKKVLHCNLQPFQDIQDAYNVSCLSYIPLCK